MIIVLEKMTFDARWRQNTDVWSKTTQTTKKDTRQKQRETEDALILNN